MAELQRLLGQHGSYTVLSKLGSGANADVFRVRREGQRGFTKEVAVKVAYPRTPGIDDALERFQAEAALAGTLHHDNIVQVFDFYDLEGHLAIELELIEGLTLWNVVALAKKFNLRLPPAFSAHVGVEVLDALEYLRKVRHPDSQATGIVHRDVKPANIFVNSNGVTKVADFGVARLPDSQRTERGMVVGTFRYLPLEAFGGSPADHSWDLWGCSVVLWELFTQRAHLAAERGLPLQEWILKWLDRLKTLQVPNASELLLDLPQPVADVLSTALRRRKQDRYQTAGEMRRALLQAMPLSHGAGRDVAREVVAELTKLRVTQNPSGIGLGSLKSVVCERSSVPNSGIPKPPPAPPRSTLSTEVLDLRSAAPEQTLPDVAVADPAFELKSPTLLPKPSRDPTGALADIVSDLDLGDAGIEQNWSDSVDIREVDGDELGVAQTSQVGPLSAKWVPSPMSAEVAHELEDAEFDVSEVLISTSESLEAGPTPLMSRELPPPPFRGRTWLVTLIMVAVTILLSVVLSSRPAPNEHHVHKPFKPSKGSRNDQIPSVYCRLSPNTNVIEFRVNQGEPQPVPKDGRLKVRPGDQLTMIDSSSGERRWVVPENIREADVCGRIEPSP